MMLRPRVLFALISVVVFHASYTGCRRGSTSETKQIATDLPDDGGELGPVTIYWIFAGQVFRAECPDPEFILRRHCDQNRLSVDYATFKRELDGGLSDTIRDLTEETDDIQAAIRAVELQIALTTQTIADMERQSGTLTAEVSRLRDDIRRFDAYIREYREQLALIEDALRRLADADLSAQRADMVIELARCQSNISAIAGQVDIVLDQIRGISSDVARLTTQLTSLTNRARNLRVDLALVSTRLAAAHDDFSVYESTLGMLQDNIIFRVLADQDRFQKVRQFVRRFEAIFDDVHS